MGPQIAIALWEYTAQEDDEHNLNPGDQIVVTELCNNDWYEGNLNGKTAYFPAKYVRILPPGESYYLMIVKDEFSKPAVPKRPEVPKPTEIVLFNNHSRKKKIKKGCLILYQQALVTQ